MELSEYPDGIYMGVRASKRKRRWSIKGKGKVEEEKRRESHCPFMLYSHL
jgi:hypothetical protein